MLEKINPLNDISSNPILAVIDLKYCKKLDNLALSDTFVANRVNKCIEELEKAGGINFNGHYISAYNFYNEAVTYYELAQRKLNIKHIPESSKPTPDFDVEFSFKNWEGNIQTGRVYIEVKSLAFSDGNNEYKRVQESALECNIRIEEQRGRGREFCSSEYVVSPLGSHVGVSAEINELNRKICNNIKPNQFNNDNGVETILYIDLSQYLFPYRDEECLPVYPDIQKKCSISGRLWMLAFGRENERVLTWPEFEGKGCFDKELTRTGILIGHEYIKGIIFSSGSEYGKKRLHGLYRYSDSDSVVVTFMNQICDFVNDDKNTNGYRFFEELEKSASTF